MGFLDGLIGGGIGGLGALQQAQNAYAQQVYNTGLWTTTTAGTATQTFDVSLLQAALQPNTERTKKIAAKPRREDGPEVQWLDRRINEMRVTL